MFLLDTRPIRTRLDWHHIEAAIDGRLNSCATPLRQVLPECTDDAIRSLGRSMRRTFFSALIDRTITPDEMRDELLSLVQGWRSRGTDDLPRAGISAVLGLG